MPRILIVDDEVNIRNGLKAILEQNSYEILTASNGIEALGIIQSEAIDLLVTDIKMPKMDGLRLQEEVQKTKPDLPVILLTAYGTVENAVEAMRKGAYDFLTKPVNLEKFEMVVDRALANQKLKTENEQLRSELNHLKLAKPLVGHSKPMQILFEKIKAIADTKTTVLIQGESGTGKELIARAIHELSPRKHKSFVAVNCAALNESLLESELFGHEKGSFTGATAKKEGRFQFAQGGTLFLDEIGELSLHLQVKLLRVIQEKMIEPVGSNQSIPIDVRFICATNKDLEHLVSLGKFREDLFFRINVVRIEAPPLRKRLEDIPLLVGHFIEDTCQENGKALKTISQDALSILSRHHWPGNVRELRNTIESLVIFSQGTVIGPDDLPDHLVHPSALQDTASLPRETLSLSENEKALIQKALAESKYNKTKAAQKLGMSRRTLHRKINEYQLDT